jgi:hypothetical protein
MIMKFSTFITRALPQVALSISLLAAWPAHAGRACEEKMPKAEDVRSAMQLALKSRQALDQSGASVALIARVGQDLSKYKLKYSHIGFAWRDHPQGKWLVVHELNQCGTAQSSLYNEGLGNFFLDDMHAYETLIVVPSAEVQAALEKLFAAGKAPALHEPKYNMLAYPFSTKYQNSNQWVLETLVQAVALSNAQPYVVSRKLTRADAQAWLQSEGYVPTTLNLGPVTRLGARSRANIVFDDHPNDKRFSDRIEVVSVDSMVTFMERKRLIASKLELLGP